MKLHKLKVTSRTQIKSHPRLWLELVWELGDGDYVETNRIGTGFRNENEFIHLYRLWKPIESVDFEGNFWDNEAYDDLLFHLGIDSDDFGDFYLPSDPKQGTNYNLKSVTMKGHNHGIIETYSLV